MTHYTNEKHAQIVIALLKGHAIRHVIASPGTTNMAFVGSIQADPFFIVYSAVDERSAAYMACGLAAELDAPVVLSCTGATASRNYMPGLTEAYYRKLPVLAVTSMQGRGRAGHHIAQVIDRTSLPKDVVKLSVDLPIVKDAEDIWECEMKVNQAILELTRRGGGPAHINLPTTYSRHFNERELPPYRVIRRWTVDDQLPELKGKIAVFIGAHRAWQPDETAALDEFCEVNNAVVFCDHTSGYHGKYRILSALLGGQEGADQAGLRPDVTIHIGEVSGDYEIQPLIGKDVWRVSRDGEVRDTFRNLSHVFEMSERAFFRRYSSGATQDTTYFKSCHAELEEKRAKLPELPLSNIWLASQFSRLIPENCVIHFAILNSLRAWNFFDLPEGVRSSANVGGFGIDGCMSSLIGASLASPDRLSILVTGDLAFFYDMNSLGNRHVGPNVRILLVNNGKGTEFTQHGHPGSAFGRDADKFIAAGGHFGQQSADLVKGYAEALGMKYIGARNKVHCKAAMEQLLSPTPQGRAMLVEVFVTPEDESAALKAIRALAPSSKAKARQLAKDILGRELVQVAKKILAK